MSSASESEAPYSGSESSVEEDPIRTRSVSATPFSPRKRRRSSSVDSLRSRKRHLDGKYNDAYRTLYNGIVESAATRYQVEDEFQPNAATVGVSHWAAQEKSIFFAALGRLGRDDLPGIAGAIGSKSIPEVRQFLLLVEEAYAKHKARPKHAKFTVEDIPAALEVGVECQDRLELAGDALAWYQERFEARQEEERYGNFWLITSEVAADIEEAVGPAESRAVSPVVKNEDGKPGTPPRTTPQVLQSVPEADLLDAGVLLHLSKHYFMNPSPTVPYPWPHWTELVSEVAAEPSIYRSAFGDLHTLVVFLTRRLVQTTIIQATARIRTQGWRTKKGLLPYIKRRDALTAIDLMGLSRNSREYWKGAARRCGLRVQKGIRRVGGHGGKRSVEVSWDEVEWLLDSANILTEAPTSTDAGTAGVTSGTDEDMFKSRALRSGTPLPTAPFGPQTAFEMDEQSDVSRQGDESSICDEYYPPVEAASDDSMPEETISDVEDARDLSEDEEEALEHFDQNARREDERYLWGLLSDTPNDQDHESERLQHETAEPEAKRATTSSTRNQTSDWRDWVQYRAPWEEFRTPVPQTSFFASNTALPLASVEQQESNSDSNFGRSRDADLPIRGARAYAAMQERAASSDEESAVSNAGEKDRVDIPAQSVEVIEDDDAMDWE